MKLYAESLEQKCQDSKQEKEILLENTNQAILDLKL